MSEKEETEKKKRQAIAVILFGILINSIFACNIFNTGSLELRIFNLNYSHEK